MGLKPPSSTLVLRFILEQSFKFLLGLLVQPEVVLEILLVDLDLGEALAQVLDGLLHLSRLLLLLRHGCCRQLQVVEYLHVRSEYYAVRVAGDPWRFWLALDIFCQELEQQLVVKLWK